MTVISSKGIDKNISSSAMLSGIDFRGGGEFECHKVYKTLNECFFVLCGTYSPPPLKSIPVNMAKWYACMYNSNKSGNIIYNVPT